MKSRPTRLWMEWDRLLGVETTSSQFRFSGFSSLLWRDPGWRSRVERLFDRRIVSGRLLRRPSGVATRLVCPEGGPEVDRRSETTQQTRGGLGPEPDWCKHESEGSHRVRLRSHLGL